MHYTQCTFIGYWQFAHFFVYVISFKLHLSLILLLLLLVSLWNRSAHWSWNSDICPRAMMSLSLNPWIWTGAGTAFTNTVYQKNCCCNFHAQNLEDEGNLQVPFHGERLWIMERENMPAEPSLPVIHDNVSSSPTQLPTEYYEVTLLKHVEHMKQKNFLLELCLNSCPQIMSIIKWLLF